MPRGSTIAESLPAVSPVEPFAAIDVGAHSVRLGISLPLQNGSLQLFDQCEVMAPLGEDVFRTGEISPENTRLVGEILADYAQVIREHGISPEHYRAFATSAVREALNRDIFLHRVRELSGIRLEVLPETEEIRLVFLALADTLGTRYRFNQNNAVICVVGTGSTELCFTENGLLTHAEAARLGTLRVVEQLAEPVSAARLRQIIDPFIGAVVNGVARVSYPGRPNLFIAMGAASRALVKIGGYRFRNGIATIRRTDFDRIFSQIAGTPAGRLAEKYGLPDVVGLSIEPCCNMLNHLFELTQLNRMIVAAVTTREAVIRELVRRKNAPDNAPDPFTPHLIAASRHLAERFNVDLEHAGTVAALAVQLFDGLQPLHRLGPRDRLLLEAAGWLHDVGFFISNRAHHKHSYYLLAASEIPGVPPEEQKILATVARYHRKALPQPGHPEYAALPHEDRVRVAKLASILRVADALDRCHQSKFQELTVRALPPGQAVIEVAGSADLTLERWGLRKKADLFRRIFGRTVILEGRSLTP